MTTSLRQIVQIDNGQAIHSRRGVQVEKDRQWKGEGVRFNVRSLLENNGFSLLMSATPDDLREFAQHILDLVDVTVGEEEVTDD